MLLTLQRTRENHLSTVGTLTGGFFSLEDGYRDPKVPGETRIPAGVFFLKLRTEGALDAKYLTRFGPDFHKGMIWLQDVPGFSFVYLHIGNDVEDTEGCILVGSHVIAPSNPREPFRIGESEKAYRAFYPSVAAAILRGDDMFLKVQDRAAVPVV